MSVLDTLVKHNECTFYTCIPPDSIKCDFYTCWGMYLTHRTDTHTLILYTEGQSNTGQSDTDTYTPPYTFLGAIKGVFGGKEIYTYKYTNEYHS